MGYAYRYRTTRAIPQRKPSSANFHRYKPQASKPPAAKLSVTKPPMRPKRPSPVIEGGLNLSPVWTRIAEIAGSALGGWLGVWAYHAVFG
ncbi:hypothetical protein CcrC1_gp088 [Caulobacter phage C1]|nr:hypothetical protein CcrC1_gp088 [Caulobacter phage C1]UTU08316.1 hypothetical protein CcrC2_gp088 [Caulobacter phage C2]UTU08837.1 hypothetical protein CcrJ4_gp086 [Caulobacter phage J4]UTU09390.1 hypothetical protein CcrBL47_gp104 [Caulobacter phage BL47]UTU09950.1 hypothetical protein CcrRB23_gp088 [Caulobacter phage RB23]WGN96975.1 hypothetical protein [Bertelyvirus sp.]